MKAKHVALLLATASVFAAVATGACSSTESTPCICDGLPPSNTLPSNDPLPAGITLGAVCHDAIYESLDLGYVACDDGHWTFTATDPSADGYTLVSDAGSGIDDASPQDAGSADDAGANDDASSGDGG